MTLSTEHVEKLIRLQNYRTHYEAVVVHHNGEKRLLAYSGRKPRHGLLAAAQQRGAAVIAFLGLSETDQMSWLKDELVLCVTGNVIRWSGRTQRDAIMEGELPYIRG